MISRTLSVAESRELDRHAVEQLGIPSMVLMENAVSCVAREAMKLGTRFLVLCGPGNNGGDGMVALRHLLPDARGILLAEPDPARAPDAALQHRILKSAGVVLMNEIPSSEMLEAFQADRGLVWIDALFGLGLKRPATGATARLIEAFNRSKGPRLAVDLPSGLDGDDGLPLGLACRAHVTVTFEAMKLGLIQAEGKEYAGRIVIAPLGIPHQEPS
jgi:NAD(P)H-hydrate epimerase